MVTWPGSSALPRGNCITHFTCSNRSFWHPKRERRSLFIRSTKPRKIFTVTPSGQILLLCLAPQGGAGALTPGLIYRARSGWRNSSMLRKGVNLAPPDTALILQRVYFPRSIPPFSFLNKGYGMLSVFTCVDQCRDIRWVNCGQDGYHQASFRAFHMHA